MKRCATIGAVTWQEAKAIAEAWAQEYLPQDLKGRTFTVPGFTDDATAQFFSAQRTLEDHRMIVSALARMARKRGARIVHHIVSTDHYELTRRAGALEDTPEVRADYLQGQYRID